MLEISTSKTERFKVAAALVFTITLWASAFVGIRAGLDGFQPGSLALLRFLVASFVMALLFARHSDKRPVRKQDLPTLILIGFFGYAVYNVALNQGEVTVTAGIASFIMSLAPILVIIFASYFLKERLRLFQWLGVLVSVIGVFIISLGRGGFEQIDTGVIFIIIAAFSAAIYVVLQKPMLKNLSALQLTTFGIWIGTFFMLVYLPSLIHDFASASLTSILAVAYLGVFPAAFGFLAWSYVLARFDASRAIMALYTMPLVATFFSWLLLGEVPTFISFVGGLVAVAGAIIVNFKSA